MVWKISFLHTRRYFTQQTVDLVTETLELRKPYTLFWVQEMLEFTAELGHNLRMKALLLLLILTISQFALIQTLLLLKIRTSSWTAFMGHISLKVPLSPTISSVGVVAE